MRVSELVMMVLVAGLFVVGGSLYMAEIAVAYDVEGVPNLAALNQTTEVTSIVSQMQITMRNTTTGNPLLDIANNAWNFVGFMSSAFIKTGLLMLSSPLLLTNMFQNEAGTGMLDLIPNFPSWIAGLVFVMITVLISFAIYRTVAKSDI